MKAQEKLVKLMEYKQKVIDKLLKDIADVPRYFDDKDKEYLLKLDDKIAGRINRYIVRQLLNSIENLNSLCDTICPFCVENNLLPEELEERDCMKCFYSKNHGDCENYYESDFNIITDLIRKKLKVEYNREAMIFSTKKMLSILQKQG